jgi:hypothetical protein
MIWVLVAVAALWIVARLFKGRAAGFDLHPSQPLSTLDSAWSRRTSKETKAALNAATSLLR